MESGEFSRGKESIRAEGGIVMVGNFDVDVRRRAAAGPPLRADAEGDARRHGVPRPHPRVPSRLGRPEARPVVLHRAFRVRQRLPRRVLEPAAPHLAARCDAGSARVGKPAQRPRPQGRQQHGQRPAEAAVARSRDGGSRRCAGLGGRAGAGAAAAGEGAAGVHRRGRVRQGRPQLPRRRAAREESCTARSRSSTGCASRASATRSHAQAGDSEVLPEPDPAEVKSSVGAKAADYAVGDVIDGRFEILDVLGQGGFSKVYRVRDEVEGEERALQAVRQRRRLRRRAPRDRRAAEGSPPQRREGLLGGQDQRGRLVSHHRVHRRRVSRRLRHRQAHLRDREAIDVALDVLDALVAIHPDAAPLEELDQKNRDGELIGGRVSTSGWRSRTRAWCIATSSR